jgi:hypothetical protein
MDPQPDDVPPPRFMPLRTDEELLARIDQILDIDARQLPCVMVQFLDKDARELPIVVPIDGIGREPDPRTATNLCWIISLVLGEHAPGGSAVLTLTRWGSDEIGPDDRAWRDAIATAAASQQTNIRLLCLGTRDGIRVLRE